MKLRASAFALAAVGFGIALPAYGTVVVLPDAYVDTTPTEPTFGTYTQSLCPGGNNGGCSLTQTSSYQAGNLAIMMTGSGGITEGVQDGWQTDLRAGLFYEVVGPASTSPIPLLVTAQGTTSVGAPQSAMTAYVSALPNTNFEVGSFDPVDKEGLQPIYLAVAASCNGVSVESYCSDYGNPASSFSGTYSFSVQANQIGQVDEDLRGAMFGYATGTIDPTVQIDPNWLANNPGYSLFLSTNFGGPIIGGIPEPATWTMLILGFGVIGGMLRRSRNFEARTV